MKWHAVSFGNASGKIVLNDDIFELSLGTSYDLNTEPFPDEITIESVKGKFGETEDSFLYVYTQIDPYKENIDMSAQFRVLSDEPTRWLSGYGLLATDTVISTEDHSRFRNYLATGRFRTFHYHEIGCGRKIIAGYKDTKDVKVADERITNIHEFPSLTYDTRRITKEECFLFHMCKEDDDIRVSVEHNGRHEGNRIEGYDYLLKQEQDKIYFGFAVAGNLTLRIDNINAQINPGKFTAHNAEIENNVIIDYPFPRDRFARETGKRKAFFRIAYVSPDGKAENSGSFFHPLDLQTALNTEKYRRIIMKDGVYYPEDPCYLFNRDGKKRTLKAQHPDKVIIDGSKLKKQLPIMILDADKWHLKGLSFQNGPSIGLQICGNDNVIERCSASCNQDAGILLCAYPCDEKEKWPCGNHIVACDAHHNADLGKTDADGFAAKLKVGKNNIFYECISHHNCDDGFDLFAKRNIGPIEPVELANCVSYTNGKDMSQGQGMGFKLGGEEQRCRHKVINCIAFDNNGMGFSTNHNPETEMSSCTSWNNGIHPVQHNYRLSSDSEITDWKINDLFPPEAISIFAGENVWQLKDKDNTQEILKERYRDDFESLDTSTKILRDRNGLIEMQGLFKKKDDIPGSDLPEDDRKHKKERIRRYRRLCKIR